VRSKLGQIKTVVSAFGVSDNDVVESQVMVNPPSISGSSNYVASEWFNNAFLFTRINNKRWLNYLKIKKIDHYPLFKLVEEFGNIISEYEIPVYLGYLYYFYMRKSEP